MEIIRNPDGSLLVLIPEKRRHDSDDGVDTPSGVNVDVDAEPTTRLLTPPKEATAGHRRMRSSTRSRSRSRRLDGELARRSDERRSQSRHVARL